MRNNRLARNRRCQGGQRKTSTKPKLNSFLDYCQGFNRIHSSESDSVKELNVAANDDITFQMAPSRRLSPISLFIKLFVSLSKFLSIRPLSWIVYAFQHVLDYRFVNFHGLSRLRLAPCRRLAPNPFLFFLLCSRRPLPFKVSGRQKKKKKSTAI